MTSVAASRPIVHRSPASRCKELLLGPPLATSRLVRERLRKVVALAVFSSDAISSTAHGTEQIMLVLVAAGAVATGLAFPIALAIGALLAILVLSYRQTITAYPSAGGAYVVSRDNFGHRWALVAGSALLIDYVLTVAVSVTSGVAALTTAFPPLQRLVLPLSLAVIGLIMWANLRGVREAGRIFAVPTYLFVGACAVMLLVGLTRLATGRLDPIPAAGQVVFYLFQAATLAILVLAANTSFAGFPRLVSFAAADAFLARWFTKRGQRLVHSNGVLALSAAAAAVTLAFRADYNHMLPLYAIGVFTSFTFSQAGMTRRHLRLREPGWRHGIAVNGTGALATALVAVPLEVVHCPDRDLVDCATDAVGERVNPDTEVTVLLPRHGDQGRFRRLLHDQTGRDLFAALNRLGGVNVAIVHPPAATALRRTASAATPLTTP